MSTGHRIAATAVTAVLAAGGVAVPAGAASARVLVSAAQPSVRLHHDIRVGVWYRTWDGGPRAYRVRVLDPDGRVVFSRQGKAPNRWRMWSVRADRTGTWRTVYAVRKAGGWQRARFRTVVHR